MSGRAGNGERLLQVRLPEATFLEIAHWALDHSKTRSAVACDLIEAGTPHVFGWGDRVALALMELTLRCERGVNDDAYKRAVDDARKAVDAIAERWEPTA